MTYKEDTNNDNSKYSILIEIVESDIMGMELNHMERKFIQKKMKSKVLSEKMKGIYKLVSKIEERNFISKN